MGYLHSSFVFFLSFLLIPDTTHSCDIVVYWGQDGKQNLSETCTTGIYSIINIAFLVIANDPTHPELNLEGHCGLGNSCSFISRDIKMCQKKGIKVMLSLGASIEHALASSEDAKKLSEYLWHNFLGGGSRNSSSGPFGDAVLDGIDFATSDSSTAKHWDELARYLKSHSTKTQNIYLSAAPKCPFPDYVLGKALETGLFDYVWIQYYDNPSCGYDEGNVSGFFTSWNTWTTSLKTEKVFLGLAASPDDVSYGYIPVHVLTSQILSVLRKTSNYGGVTISSPYEDEMTGISYSKVIWNDSNNKTISENHLCPHKIDFGCARHQHGFVERFGHMAATHGFLISSKNESIDRQCCEVICRNNCFCDAYAPLYNNTGCQLWSKGIRFIKSSVRNSQRVYFVKQKVKMCWIWCISSVGAAVAFFYLYCVLSRKYKAAVDRKTKKKKLLIEVGDNSMGNHANAQKTLEDGKTIDEIQVFNLETLIVATNNFSLDNKLGEGGFGPVYKGKLINGQEIAIKRLSESSGQGILEFKNEAKIMVKLQHTYLVRLLGICTDKDERILIYEYMSNKSLDFYLFDASRKNVLDWEKRHNIIECIAQGLVYLHRYSRVKVIHRDLKPSNVLLDEEMNPKISDFGMAKIFGLKGHQENTNRIVGTHGYMPPEYAIRGVVSIKTDIYSFGVMLLEIISGMKNNSLVYSNEPFNLIGHAWLLWNENRALELIDSSLKESYNSVEVLRCIHIGLLCVQHHARKRPTTQDVVSFLSNYAIHLSQPKKPAFFESEVEEESGTRLPRQETYSLNGVSISTIYGR